MYMEAIQALVVVNVNKVKQSQSTFANDYMIFMWGDSGMYLLICDYFCKYECFSRTAL